MAVPVLAILLLFFSPAVRVDWFAPTLPKMAEIGWRWDSEAPRIIRLRMWYSKTLKGSQKVHCKARQAHLFPSGVIWWEGWIAGGCETHLFQIQICRFGFSLQIFSAIGMAGWSPMTFTHTYTYIIIYIYIYVIFVGGWNHQLALIPARRSLALLGILCPASLVLEDLALIRRFCSRPESSLMMAILRFPILLPTEVYTYSIYSSIVYTYILIIYIYINMYSQSLSLSIYIYTYIFWK